MIPKSLIFISAQPDEVYFHWQVELYLYNFAKHGIPKEQLFAIFGYKHKPSAYIQNLKKTYPGIFWYPDTRDKIVYIPSIRPHILKHFFAEFPDLGKQVFYHDSDILFYKLPDFKTLVKGPVAYLSDTISYIGYKYITDCCQRYHKQHPQLSKLDLLEKMASSAGISVELIKENQENSGGAQYLFKNIDADFWKQSEIDGVNLYKLMVKYEKNNPIAHHIQKWTAGMWSELWNYWKRGMLTKIHPEMSFSWATFKNENNSYGYKSHNIFHLAGITEEFMLKNPDFFYKGKYIQKNIIEMLKQDIHVFDYVSPDNGSGMYIQNAISYVSEKYDIFYGKRILKTQNQSQKTNIRSPTKLIKESIKYSRNQYIFYWDDPEMFSFEFPIKYQHLSGLYLKTDKKYFNKHLWKGDNQKIIFYNDSNWVITADIHENEISETCGGFVSSMVTDKLPYECDWKLD